MNLKKILMWAGVALLLFYLISQPMGAAGQVHGILNYIRNGAEAIITFGTHSLS